MMFEHLNGSFGHDIHVLLSWWVVIGFFMASFLPSCKGDKKKALIQCLILGPLFWIVVPIFGLFLFAKNKDLPEGEKL